MARGDPGSHPSVFFIIYIYIYMYLLYSVYIYIAYSIYIWEFPKIGDPDVVP